MKRCIQRSVLACSLLVLVSTGAAANTIQAQVRSDVAVDVSLAALFVPERVQFVDHPRMDPGPRGAGARSSSPGARSAGYSVESDSVAMLLAVVALIGYVIGRRRGTQS